MGVFKLLKDPAHKCDLDSSLLPLPLPLPVSPREMSSTKNSSMLGNEISKVNISKIKSSYYDFIQLAGLSSKMGSNLGEEPPKMMTAPMTSMLRVIKGESK